MEDPRESDNLCPKINESLTSFELKIQNLKFNMLMQYKIFLL